VKTKTTISGVHLS